ncbi:copper amine oxidase [Paenibacillus cellulositrophicus]|uniref:copper amine oxidase n=1 Tax=Paenibacillus cellulositrophicus TaxID=562959 RepID=UPI003D953715
MKKWTYLLSGVVIGAIIATSSSAFAAQVKSLVGKKVTGEYTVVVDGKTLIDKGAVIDSKANAPVRALSEALGADVQVSGKTISITSADEPVTTTDPSSGSSTSVPANSTQNKYMGGTKESLLMAKESYEKNILEPLKNSLEQQAKRLELAKAAKDDKGIAMVEDEIARLNADWEKYTKEVQLIDEALAAIENK